MTSAKICMSDHGYPSKDTGKWFYGVKRLSSPVEINGPITINYFGNVEANSISMRASNDTKATACK
jgi:hypothetical protein